MLCAMCCLQRPSRGFLGDLLSRFTISFVYCCVQSKCIRAKVHILHIKNEKIKQTKITNENCMFPCVRAFILKWLKVTIAMPFGYFIVTPCLPSEKKERKNIFENHTLTHTEYTSLSWLDKRQWKDQICV